MKSGGSLRRRSPAVITRRWAKNTRVAAGGFGVPKVPKVPRVLGTGMGTGPGRPLPTQGMLAVPPPQLMGCPRTPPSWGRGSRGDAVAAPVPAPGVRVRGWDRSRRPVSHPGAAWPPHGDSPTAQGFVARFLPLSSHPMQRGARGTRGERGDVGTSSQPRGGCATAPRDPHLCVPSIPLCSGWGHGPSPSIGASFPVPSRRSVTGKQEASSLPVPGAFAPSAPRGWFGGRGGLPTAPPGPSGRAGVRVRSVPPARRCREPCRTRSPRSWWITSWWPA